MIILRGLKAFYFKLACVGMVVFNDDWKTEPAKVVMQLGA